MDVADGTRVPVGGRATALGAAVLGCLLAACGGRSDGATTRGGSESTAPPRAEGGPAVGHDPVDEGGREPSVPDPSARMENGFFLADGAPEPLTCAADEDCLGDTVPAPGGCCQNPLDLRAYSQAYRTWLARWRPAHCGGVTCPEPPAASQPGDCYFQVHCTTEGICANSCRF
jgi:hypothetical protein